MFQFVLKKILGSYNERILKKLHPLVEAVGNFEPEIQKLSDEALRAKTDEFRKQLREGKILDDLLPEF